MAILLALQAMPAAFAQTGNFTVNGDLSRVGGSVTWVYLSYIENGIRVNDSTLVKGGQYRFTGKIEEPVQAALLAKYQQANGATASTATNYARDYAVIFLEPGATTGVQSADSFSNITVSGSAADAEYRKLQQLAKPYNHKLDSLYQLYSDAKKRRDTAALKSLDKAIDDADAFANEIVYGAYVRSQPKSVLALYALRNWAGYAIDPAKIEPVFKSLPAAARNSPSGKDLADKISIAKKTGIGQVAMNFTQNDTAGKPLSLAAFRGKYLLVDFWASWCGPCRLENPGLVKAFHKFRGKSFNVLGVSLDRPGGRDKWLQAIHDDGLEWFHVSDLQFWNNAVAKQYGIQAIPQNLLIDPGGKIIAKNLHGDELEKKLSEIFPD